MPIPLAIIPIVTGLAAAAAVAGGGGYSAYGGVDAANQKDEASAKDREARAAADELRRKEQNKKFLSEELGRRDVARSLQRGQGASTSEGTILTGNLGGVPKETANTYNASKLIGR